MAKSDKMYSKSPSLKRDGESGKMGISKPTEADAENMGVAGDNVQGEQSEMPMNVEQVKGVQNRHQTEMKDMHKRHQDEHKDMHKRHIKEISKTFSPSEQEGQ